MTSRGQISHASGVSSERLHHSCTVPHHSHDPFAVGKETHPTRAPGEKKKKNQIRPRITGASQTAVAWRGVRTPAGSAGAARRIGARGAREVLSANSANRSTLGGSWGARASGSISATRARAPCARTCVRGGRCALWEGHRGNQHAACTCGGGAARRQLLRLRSTHSGALQGEARQRRRCSAHGAFRTRARVRCRPKAHDACVGGVSRAQSAARGALSAALGAPTPARTPVRTPPTCLSAAARTPALGVGASVESNESRGTPGHGAARELHVPGRTRSHAPSALAPREARRSTQSQRFCRAQQRCLRGVVRFRPGIRHYNVQSDRRGCARNAAGKPLPSLWSFVMPVNSSRRPEVDSPQASVSDRRASSGGAGPSQQEQQQQQSPRRGLFGGMGRFFQKSSSARQGGSRAPPAEQPAATDAVDGGEHGGGGVTAPPSDPPSGASKAGGDSLLQVRPKTPPSASVPEALQCPICFEPMVDPVLVSSGHTFDRGCLQRWFAESGSFTCPNTRAPLIGGAATQMIPNIAVRQMVEDWATRTNTKLREVPKGDASVARQPTAAERRGARQAAAQAAAAQTVEEGGSHQGPGLLARRTTAPEAQLHSAARVIGAVAHPLAQPPSEGAMPAASGAAGPVTTMNALQVSHTDEVWALLVYHGKIFSGSKDTNVHVWDADTLSMLGQLCGHGGSVLALVGVNDKVFSGAYDNTVRVWDAVSLSPLVTLHGHTDAVRAMTVAGGRVFSASYDGTLRCWDSEELCLVGVMEQHTDAVRDLAVGGGYVFSASYDSTVRAWNQDTLELRKTMLGHSAMVRALEFAGGRLFSGSDDFSVRAWDVGTLEPLAELRGHTDMVRVLASHGERLFSGSWDFSVCVWDTAQLSCLAVLQGHVDMVLALAAKDGLLFSGSYDSCCRVWSTDDWRCVQVMQGHADAVRVLTLDEDGKRLFSGSYDAAVCAWEV